MTDSDLIHLRADLAERSEDLRIARKHRDEAADRIGSPEGRRAYDRAQRWVERCEQREAEAREELIAAINSERLPLALMLADLNEATHGLGEIDGGGY